MKDFKIGAPVPLKGNFVFIDAELANRQEDICQIGAIVVHDGIIVDIICEYVKPFGEFNNHKYCRDKHGITPEMVAGSPNFREVWDNKFDRYNDYIFVAHNAKNADIPWILKNLRIYGKEIRLRFYCTLRLAKLYLYETLHVLPDRELSREAICKALGFPIEKSHDALSDAKDCFRIFCYIDEHRGDDLPQPEIYDGNFVRCERKPDPYKEKYGDRKFSMKEIAATISRNDESDADFFQKRVVVSGKFERFKTREELAEEIYKRGAIKVLKSVSKKTDLLFLGSDYGAEKLNEAQKLNEEGAHIRIIYDEALLYRMLEDNAAVEENK